MTTYITTPGAALRLNAAPSTVRRWCEAGILKAVKIGGNYLIDPADLDTFTPPQRGWVKGKPRRKMV